MCSCGAKYIGNESYNKYCGLSTRKINVITIDRLIFCFWVYFLFLYSNVNDVACKGHDQRETHTFITEFQMHVTRVFHSVRFSPIINYGKRYGFCLFS